MTTIQSVAAILFGFAIAALVWPYSCYPLWLRLLPERPLKTDCERPATASLLFCAFNEERAIADKISNLRALKARHPNLEILAYDDGSSDATRELLAEAQDILRLIEGDGRRGKAHGMKQLASIAEGDVLVFTDANVEFADDAIDRLLDAYRDPDVGGALGTLGYRDAGASSTAAVGARYWRIEEALKALESRCGSVMGADGSIFSVRRALYPQFPDDVLDDFTVSMAVVFAGQRLVRVAEARAYEAATVDRADEARRKRRIAARSWRTHRFLTRQRTQMSGLNQFKYASRKTLRWFGAGFLMVAVLAGSVLAAAITAWLAVALWATGILALAVGMATRRGPLAQGADIIGAYFATFGGIIAGMRGADYTTWTPPVSRL